MFLLYFALEPCGHATVSHNYVVTVGRYGPEPDMPPRHGIERGLVDMMDCAVQSGCIISPSGRLPATATPTSGSALSKTVKWVIFLRVEETVFDTIFLDVPGRSARLGAPSHVRKQVECNVKYARIGTVFAKSLQSYVGRPVSPAPQMAHQPTVCQEPITRALLFLEAPAPVHIGPEDGVSQTDRWTEVIISATAHSRSVRRDNIRLALADGTTMTPRNYFDIEQTTDGAPEQQESPRLSAKRVRELLAGDFAYDEEFFLPKNRGLLLPEREETANANKVPGRTHVSPRQTLDVLRGRLSTNSSEPH